MVSPRYVAAIDQGTTSTRCMVFDRQGRMISIAQREHRRYFPRPGWVEHDAAEIWSIVKRILPQALSEAGIGADQIVALGVTNQRETTVVWDPRTGHPVAKAIVWQDTRTGPLLARIEREFDAGPSIPAPPVRFQVIQLSMVPNSSSPRSAQSCKSGSESSSQRSFGSEK